MTVNALFFAHYADIAGSRVLPLTLPERATVRDAARVLQSRFPALPDLLHAGRAAVNAAFAMPDALLHDGDEVAWLPPVSGGC